MKGNIYSLIVVAAILSSCTDVVDHGPAPEINQLRAIVVNEGQFSAGTASLTTLSASGEVEQDVFRRTNNRPIGDVAQSLCKIGENYYVPLNNSKKIEVFDAKTFKSVETMELGVKATPMYIQHLGGDSIAVTDQSSRSKLMIMDINHNKQRVPLRRYIELNGRSFQMQLIKNKLFVGGDNLTVFDLANLTQEGMRMITNKSGQTLRLADFSKVVADQSDRIWVLTASALYCIDPVTEQTVYELDVKSLNVNSWASSLDISPDKSTLYFNSGGIVYAVSTNHPVVPDKPVFIYDIDKKNTVYLMTISKENTLFINEVTYGSLSRGKISEYDIKSGELIRRFESGLFPHYIYFE